MTRRFKSVFLLTCSSFSLAVSLAFGQANIITTVAGGGTQNNIPGTSADISSPTGIAVDANNNIYFSAPDLCQIFKLAPSGKVFVVAGTGTCGFSGNGGPATSAQLSVPNGIALDSSGNLFFDDGGNYRIRRIDAATQTITTYAGDGVFGYSGDGGPATSAELSMPAGVALDSSGNLYFADTGNACIRRVDAKTQAITTVAGTGTAGFNGDSIAATAAQLSGPYGVALDQAGDIFISDNGNNRIRRVDAATGNITTVAGTGVAGDTGDGAAASSAEIRAPRGIIVDGSGDLYFVDTGNDLVRRVDHATQNITTVAGGFYYGFSGDGGPATSASLYAPDGVALDSLGNLFITDVLNLRVRRVDGATQTISTVAGGGSGGDNGPATAVQMVKPQGVAADATGNIFIADTYSHRIRRVDATTQVVTTVAGTGTSGFSGEGGPGESAELKYPMGVAQDTFGNLFIADMLNERIRRLDAVSQIITTVAGTGFYGYNGDGSTATAAQLNSPIAVAVDGSGNLFIADQLNQRIRRVDAKTQVITTVAGNGTAGFNNDGVLATTAELNGPSGVAVDGSGNLFIADTINNRIRRVDAGTQIITTVAGNGSGTCPSGDGVLATLVELCTPSSVTVDRAGNLYFSEAGLGRVRRVDVATQIINTVAGNGNSGFSGDGNPAVSAQLNDPSGLMVDDSGRLLIADQLNNRIRATLVPPFLLTQPGTLSFSTQALGTASASQAVTLTNTGVVQLTISSIGISAGFTETDNCAAGVASLATCTINVSFAPSMPGSQAGTLTIAGNAFGGPQAVNLSGAAGVGPVASLGEASLTFSNQLAGTTSSAQTLTLRNNGNGPMTVTSIVAGGDFAASNNCNGSVAAGGSCTISVTFAPTVVGPRTGTLTVTDNSQGVAGSTQTASLSGTGLGPLVSLSGSSLAFAGQLITTASPPQTVTITNSGTANLTVSTVSIAGQNATDFAKRTDTCTGATVAPGGTCTISVTFTPGAVGARGGTLTVTDNAAGSPRTVTLLGTGQDFNIAVTSSGSSTATVTPGQVATYLLSIGGFTGLSQTINFACSGAPSESICTVSPSSVPPGTAGPVALTVQATTTAPTLAPPTARRAPPFRPEGVGRITILLLGLLISAGLAGGWAGRYPRPAGLRFGLAIAACLVLALALAACGGGGGGGGGSVYHDPGTPTGTYTLTVTGSASALQHTTTLTLTVN